MPEGRFVSKSIAWSEQVGSVSLIADYLFTRMIPHLDRDGRISGSPKAVKAMVCPLRDDVCNTDVESALAELAVAGLILWYRVGAQHCVEFPEFANHQRGAKLDREAPSRLPPSSDVSAEQVRTYSGVSPDKVLLSKEKLSEVKSSEVKVLPTAAVRISDDSPPAKPRAPRKTKTPPPDEPPAVSWVTEGAAFWNEAVGDISPGQFGKTLKRMVDMHTWEKLQPDLIAWVVERQTAGKACNVDWYAKEASARIGNPNLPMPPLVDPNTGWLTAYGERITRPKAA